MFYINDTQAISNVRQCPVCGIEEHICTCVILRSYPFSLQDSPERFRNVQMRRIWWKEKQKKSSVFPYRSEFLNQLVPMHCSIVEPRVIMPKMLSLATLWGGTNTSSPFNCQPVWYISFRTGVAFIGIIECNAAFICLSFKFLQLLGLVFIELRLRQLQCFWLSHI